MTRKMTKHFIKLWWVFGIIYNIEGSRPVSDSGLPRIVHHPSDVVVRVGSPATLSCRAEGNPEPTIQWLRNGQPLDTEKMDAQSQPIVLPEGSLFFFSVVPGRKSQSHEAVYACVARNSAGVATSRNASLHIAALREEFRVQPSDVEVAVGEVAVMNCSPPVGHPEPNITRGPVPSRRFRRVCVEMRNGRVFCTDPMGSSLLLAFTDPDLPRERLNSRVLLFPKAYAPQAGYTNPHQFNWSSG